VSAPPEIAQRASLVTMRVVVFIAVLGARVAAFAPVRPRAAPSLVARQAGAYLEKDAEGLYYVALEHDSGASAKAFVLGADVTSYKDAGGTEWIAVRPDAKMDGSKPISGGLSHCFPQFGPGAIQQHGFARNVDWDIVGTGDSSVTFRLAPSATSRAMWDEPFAVDYTVALTATSLDTTLTVANTGGADASFDFQAALHSYFDASSLEAISVTGSFAGASYLDKTQDPPKRETEARAALKIDEAYDRVYAGVNDPVLVDAGKDKKLVIANKRGWKDTVVWSPYGDEGMGYDKFLCVESVAFEPVTVKGGEAWVGELSLVPEAL
jgi:glucose-6-phosphate 1-epimerase